MKNILVILYEDGTNEIRTVNPQNIAEPEFSKPVKLYKWVSKEDMPNLRYLGCLEVQDGYFGLNRDKVIAAKLNYFRKDRDSILKQIDIEYRLATERYPRELPFVTFKANYYRDVPQTVGEWADGLSVQEIINYNLIKPENELREEFNSKIR